MSESILEGNSQVWSISFLIDNLKQCLAMNSELIIKSETEEVTEYRKYYMQVWDMQKIGFLEPSVAKPFVIFLSDLPEKLKVELQQISYLERGYVLRQAVARLFEDVNSKLYHNSISKVLKVKLEK
ncbi:MAG: hypothetical protein DA329_11005 [Candidatus Nitrosocosmicus sp.]|nr:hypothetical protein [Candidatus Nitrosocosmicus sp.]